MQELQNPLTQTFAPFHYNSYAHSAYSFTSIHPSNYEYLPNIPVTPYSLPVNSHFREEQNSSNSYLPNVQEQQFTTPLNNYTLGSDSLMDVNNNPSAKGKTNSFEYIYQ